MSGDEADGADFWSRRKAAVRAEREAERSAQEAADAAGERARLEEKTDAEILEELGLPDPDTLEAGGDFSGFLSAAVPERLRRRALRRLWGLNPVLANLDGLVDYAEDYTDAATVVSNLQTVYQVGKGMFDKFAAAAEAAEAEAGPDPAVSGEDEAVGEDSDCLQCEEDVATHNDYLHDGKTSFQLTQGVGVVQSDPGGVGSIDLQDSALDKTAEDTLARGRRMKFDFS